MSMSLDVVGAIEDAVGHRLAHAHARDLRDDVVEALDVLDVERRVDVDAGGEQLLDVEVALRVAAARRVGVGELVDEDEARAALEHRVEVHLVEQAPLVVDRAPRHDSRPSRRAWVSPARASPRRRPRRRRPRAAWPARRLSISKVLPTPGAAPRKIFSRPFRRSRGARGGFAGRVGGSPLDVPRDRRHGRPVLSSWRARPSARLRRSTLTAGSPRRPRVLPSVWATTRPRSLSAEMLRAFATRGIWNSAPSGLMSGSRPEAEVVTRSGGTATPGFSAFSLSASVLTRSISALLVGPRFERAGVLRVVGRRHGLAGVLRVGAARRRGAAVEVAVGREALADEARADDQTVRLDQAALRPGAGTARRRCR